MCNVLLSGVDVKKEENDPVIIMCEKCFELYSSRLKECPYCEKEKDED